MVNAMQEVEHYGGCHCKTVRFKFEGSPHLVAWDCNCSICEMKANIHVITPQSKLTILQGLNNLSLYQFGTMAAQHMFCKTCGVAPFYVPRSNPLGYGVTYACIDQGTVKSVTVKKFDGQNWEQAFSLSAISQYA
eukprot:TRINITY_DN6884_c0_g2_i3.p2 TRINITY_DN6884_c0_g2~~TRINITY_DN6884_c0_g2_i3.p2  ORF type:complete len:143 (-),score=8.69 TRINITY_DN6884_c0_g2_i3:402-806(-)